MNFNNWRTGSGGSDGQGEWASNSAEAIQNGSMPPQQYLWLHPDAALTNSEKQQLIAGLQRSLK